MDSSFEVAKKNLWRIFKHSNTKTGAMSNTLSRIFQTWVYPHYIYGSNIWIFSVFDNLRPDSKPRNGYGVTYKKLNGLYIQQAKIILGVEMKTSNIAVLVTLGWLPLHTKLGILAMTWLYRVKNYTNTSVSTMFSTLKDDPSYDEAWHDTLIFKPTFQEIIRYQHIYKTHFNEDIDLLGIQSIKEFKECIKMIAVAEFNSFWDTATEARTS